MKCVSPESSAGLPAIGRIIHLFNLFNGLLCAGYSAWHSRAKCSLLLLNLSTYCMKRTDKLTMSIIVVLSRAKKVCKRRDRQEELFDHTEEPVAPGIRKSMLKEELENERVMSQLVRERGEGERKGRVGAKYPSQHILLLLKFICCVLPLLFICSMTRSHICKAVPYQRASVTIPPSQHSAELSHHSLLS